MTTATPTPGVRNIGDWGGCFIGPGHAQKNASTCTVAGVLIRNKQTITLSSRDFSEAELGGVVIEAIALLNSNARDADKLRVDALALAQAGVVAELVEVCKVLSRIADAYDENALDDEARKVWGRNDEYTNNTPPHQIELYSGRGGRQLLTLADCFAARAALRKLPAPKPHQEPANG